MIVTLLGKEHVSGISRKTGKEFDSNVVHVAFKKKGLEGSATEIIWLNPEHYPINSLQLGKNYNLDRDKRGYVCGFDLV